MVRVLCHGCPHEFLRMVVTIFKCLFLLILVAPLNNIFLAKLVSCFCVKLISASEGSTTTRLISKHIVGSTCGSFHSGHKHLQITITVSSGKNPQCLLSSYFAVCFAYLLIFILLAPTFRFEVKESKKTSS